MDASVGYQYGSGRDYRQAQNKQTLLRGTNNLRMGTNRPGKI